MTPAARFPARHSGVMKLDTILDPADTDDVFREVAALSTYETVRVRGVRQKSTSVHYQFYVELDRVNESWYFFCDVAGGETFSYSDGVITTADPSMELDYPQGMPSEMHLLDPRLLLMWGGRSSIYPMLAQDIGKHSLLITFEHTNDPAYRPTLVIDKRTGIASRMVNLGEVTILTDVRVNVPLVRPESVTFTPITDWIRPNY